MNTVLANRTDCITLVLDDVHDPHNVAAVLRSADAFGVSRVHAVEGGASVRISNRVARGTQNWVELCRYRNRETLLERLRQDRVAIWVAAADEKSRPLEAWQPDRHPTAFVFGNEHRGVDPFWREHADEIFAIPMVGMVESLNISVACAVTLHAVRTRLERSAIDWRLTDERRQEILQHWTAQ
ncbi:MAG: TrmH family RNA methyltransferase [Candidatus Dadabacteria bacterium]|nr:MAG: TrmH family RNA methyltransferase [Candidatus Dadabacteria bacterium]